MRSIKNKSERKLKPAGSLACDQLQNNAITILREVSLPKQLALITMVLLALSQDEVLE